MCSHSQDHSSCVLPAREQILRVNRNLQRVKIQLLRPTHRKPSLLISGIKAAKYEGVLAGRERTDVTVSAMHVPFPEGTPLNIDPVRLVMLLTQRRI